MAISPLAEIRQLPPHERAQLRAKYDPWNWALNRAKIKLPRGTEGFRRDTFEELGPWDERFITALPEDASLLIKAGGFDRLSGPSYVFWHPSPIPEDVGRPR